MLCPQCGMQLLDEEHVCPSCGEPVSPGEETKVLFNGPQPDAGPDSTQAIGSEDHTMVRSPLGVASDVAVDPVAETEVLVFGGEYILDDPDETGQLGSEDPTLVKGAPAVVPAAQSAPVVTHVLPSEQGIVDLTPEEVIHAVDDTVEGSQPAAVDSAGEILAEVSDKPLVEVEEATDLLGSEFPTSVQAAHDGGPEADPDKNIKMDIDPLAGSGALDALGTLYDTGGMQFPVASTLGKALHEEQPDEGLSFARRHRKGLIALVIVIVAAVIAAGVYMFAVVWPAHAVSDDEVRQTLLHDTEFMAGRASDMYVAEESYDLKNLNIDERTADEDGLKIEATALLENRFFSESDHVTLVYPDTDNAEDYTLEVASHDVRAVRGISQDAEYGIYDANPTFDQTSQTCSLEQKRAEASGNRWWFTESGEIKLAYEFSNDAWKRTIADTSNLTSSFQHIVGSYGMDDSRLKSFTIRSVDNETGSFKGTFTWEKEGSGLFGSREMEGSFSGTVHRDGTVEAAVGDAPGTMAFTGSFGDGESLTISGTVYLDSALSTLGFSNAPTVEFSSVTLVKGSEVDPNESDADGGQGTAGATQQEQGSPSSDSDDMSGESSDSQDGYLDGTSGSDGVPGDGSTGGSGGSSTGDDSIELEPGFESAPSIDNAPWGPFSNRRNAFSWDRLGF